MRYVWLLLVLLLVGYGFTGVVQVRPGELAVVRRFGRVLPEKPGPGLRIGLPWGMDRVDRVAVDRVQTAAVGMREDAAADMPAGQFLTGDHNLVNVQATLFYKVRPDAVEDYIAARERVEGLIARAAETAMSQWVASRTIDDVLLNAKTMLPPALTRETMYALKPYSLGVDILDARITIVAPPEEVRPAFDQVTSAQTSIERAVNEAEQESRRRRLDAEAEANQTEQRAAAYAEGVVQRARAEADNFRARLQNYRTAQASNPEYLRQLWDEEMGALFQKIREKGQLAPLDHLLHSLGLDLSTMPAAPRK